MMSLAIFLSIFLSVSNFIITFAFRLADISQPIASAKIQKINDTDLKNHVIMKIQIINGPNLNLLGVREPGIYGSNSFESYLPKLKAKFPDVEIEYYQSNIEGELINKLQEVGFSYDGVVLNAGAYTHTSIALQDCIRSLKCPCVEVHISNVHKREEFRHHSYISCACLGVICGFGLASYDLAIAGILAQKENGE